MLIKRKKFSRKEIKEDRLVTFYYQAIEMFEKYKQQSLIGLGVIVGIGLITFFYISNKSSNNETANLSLANIIKSYDAGAYLDAIEGKPGTKIIGLKKIVEEYGSTENGETAKIYLANAYYFLGKYEESFKYYQDYSGNNELLKASALAGQASYYESKNDFEKAAELFRKAASVSESNVLNPNYLLNAGINYLNINKKEEAKELFQKIKKDFAASTYVREVERYLAQVE